MVIRIRKTKKGYVFATSKHKTASATFSSKRIAETKLRRIRKIAKGL